MDKVKKFFIELRFKLRQKWQRHRMQFLIDMKDFFVSQSFFDLIGFSFLRPYNPSRDFYRRIYFFIYQICWILLLTIILISTFIYINSQDSFLPIAECFAYIFAAATIFNRFFILCYKYREDIFDLLEKLELFFPHHSLDQDKYRVASRLKKYKLFCRITTLTIFSLSAHFLLFPLERQIYGLVTSQSIEWEPMLVVHLPFELKNAFRYWSVFFVEGWLCQMSVWFLIATDFLYAGLMCLTSMEFDILAEMISDIDVENNEDAIKELKKFVKIHQELIEVTEKLEKIFSPILLINICTVIMMMCLAAFLAVVNTLIAFLIMS